MSKEQLDIIVESVELLKDNSAVCSDMSPYVEICFGGKTFRIFEPKLSMTAVYNLNSIKRSNFHQVIKI